MIAITGTAQETGTFTDTRDGKNYKTVKIGQQTWLAENLAFKADSGCWFYNNKKNNITGYGYLYNYKTATTVCPEGWRLPSNQEWKILVDYLNGDSIAGYALKESGTSHWDSTSLRTNNSSGFTALPGGCASSSNAFYGIGQYGFWWSSTLSDTHYAGRLMLNYNTGYSNLDGSDDALGFSVRCLKN